MSIAARYERGAERAGDEPAHQSRRPRVVALGGGHGLHASLSALRLLDIDVTAVVTVADDGGSSGRIRRELGVLPPGDLRMAIAALAGKPSDTSGWPEVLQHRLGGSGALAGHPIGNLLLTGLLEMRGDPVDALDELATLAGARGRVLPMSLEPLDLIAEVSSVDPDDPVRRRRIRGQSAIASTAGRVTSIRLVPADAPACPAAVAAIETADAIVLGPGSWFTSVIPHLLVPELAAALMRTQATRVLVLNLEQQAGETQGFSPEEHLQALHEHCPGLRMDAVVADSVAVLDPDRLARYLGHTQSRLVLCPVAAEDAGARHDPVRLSIAVAEAAGLTAPSGPRPDGLGTVHRRDDGRRTEQGAN
ncbi:MAG TPA: uridine diphosphate-N-acetylglucosamine-binding protein YvcK [Jatrophihabitans sp.]|nr:uridine diphosphate-N-acetylglucosamine-binding protein YvcK [Jatrophihabitans sp.]